MTKRLSIHVSLSPFPVVLFSGHVQVLQAERGKCSEEYSKVIIFRSPASSFCTLLLYSFHPSKLMKFLAFFVTQEVC